MNLTNMDNLQLTTSQDQGCSFSLKFSPHNNIHHSSSKSLEREQPVPNSSKLTELTTAPKRLYNPYANALDQMIAMGFSDNDGWLTELLIRKHGDISQVT